MLQTMDSPNINLSFGGNLYQPWIPENLGWFTNVSKAIVNKPYFDSSYHPFLW
jgi:hypothetical protein